MTFLSILVVIAAATLALVLLGSLHIVLWADAPAPVEGAAVRTYRHVIALCLVVLGGGIPFLSQFPGARGLVLLACLGSLGVAFIVWRRSPVRWVAVVVALAVLAVEAWSSAVGVV